MTNRYASIVVDACGHRVLCTEGTTADQDLWVTIRHAWACSAAQARPDVKTLTYVAPDYEESPE